MENILYALLGGILGFAISQFFYWKTTRDLNAATRRLSSMLELIAKMLNKNHLEFILDDEGTAIALRSSASITGRARINANDSQDEE